MISTAFSSSSTLHLCHVSHFEIKSYFLTFCMLYHFEYKVFYELHLITIIGDVDGFVNVALSEKDHTWS